MAANDYYHTTGQSYTRNDVPFPPAPSERTQHSVSPVSASPFDDRPYLPDSSSGALGGHPDHYANTEYISPAQSNSDPHMSNGRHPDPFTDQNAIPLQHQTKAGAHHPTQYDEDPEIYGLGVEPARKHRKKRKEGWLSGRVTWVVYILTTVQIAVFVGELIKNGRRQPSGTKAAC